MRYLSKCKLSLMFVDFLLLWKFRGVVVESAIEIWTTLFVKIIAGPFAAGSVIGTTLALLSTPSPSSSTLNLKSCQTLEI